MSLPGREPTGLSINREITVNAGDNWVDVLKRTCLILERLTSPSSAVTLEVEGGGKKILVDKRDTMNLMNKLLSHKNEGAHTQQEPIPGDDILIEGSVPPDKVISVQVEDFGIASLKVILDALAQKPYVNVRLNDRIFHIEPATFSLAVKETILHSS